MTTTRVEAAELSQALVDARRVLRELPEETLEKTIALYVDAANLDDQALASRALTIQGQIAAHFGDLHGALELSVEAAKLIEGGDDLVALGESCCLRSLVSYFTGSFPEAFKQAHEAIRYADASDDVHLQLFARRNASFVFGTAELEEGDFRAEEMVELAVAVGDRWEESAARNDWALTLASRGDTEAAMIELELALKAAEHVTPNNFTRGVILGSQAEVELLARKPKRAAEHADESRALLELGGKVSPYLLSATVGLQVQARTRLGEFGAAREIAEQALAQMVGPSTRMNGAIFAALAEALKDEGRWEEAYEALSRSAELERAAFRALEDVRLDLERATLETAVLRDQLERDWLTGLYNRRFIANELLRNRNRRFGTPLSVAMIDIDHFKAINDTYGHAAGDQVLIRLANLMRGAVRPLDMIVRAGGEEFLLVMPTTGATAGTAVSERIRRAIESEDWEEIAPDLSLTVSIGVTGAVEFDDFDDLVNIADANLYEAKRAGRNRVAYTAPAPGTIRPDS